MPLYLAGTLAWAYRDRIQVANRWLLVSLVSLSIAAYYKALWPITFPVAGGYILLHLAFSQRINLSRLSHAGDFSYGTYLFAFPIQQFTTEIRAAVPRSQRSQCGAKTIAVPWSGKHSRFTLMFEAFAIRVLQAVADVSRAAALLGISWDTAHDIMATAVDRGLERREAENVEHVGIDEKSFGSGHDYV